MEVPISSAREPMSGVNRCRTARFLIVAAEPPRIFILFVLPTRVRPHHVEVPSDSLLSCLAMRRMEWCLRTAFHRYGIRQRNRCKRCRDPQCDSCLHTNADKLHAHDYDHWPGGIPRGVSAVGRYTAKVDAPGFKDVVQSGIVLSVTQQATLNFSLQPGAQNTKVNVTSQVPLVNQLVDIAAH
jgi:hypothetical protein